MKIKVAEHRRAIAAEQERQLMEDATKEEIGDSRTLAKTAASKGWRKDWGPKQQVRAEKLRRWASENPDPEVRRAMGAYPEAMWLLRDVEMPR